MTMHLGYETVPEISVDGDCGVTLAGEAAGEGTPIVLLHGLTATRRYVVMGSRALERSGHRVVAYDARGHGASAPAPEPGAYGYDELAADLAAVRDGGRVLALFQPHLYSRTLHLVYEFAVALARADAVCVTEIYAAREEPSGVSGKLVLDELLGARPGMPAGWAPSVEQGARLVAAWARPGDLVLTLGAGDVDAAGPAILDLLR
jgi:pimeloyl-ACP methyl ester carboxylesterase